ncbi:hypothetical protein F8M41_016451 [Gigaspora margarita]|uniref:Uncharacterized protein n=1 Tax=Gigaspora margarita TaxID=4874 RepID=A0A8H4APF2_GIGMA|nr:hypothetical protein F8M41_016451 [Gigaspora margarita]
MKKINSINYNGNGIEKANKVKTYYSSLQGTTCRQLDDDYFDDNKMIVEENIEIEDNKKGHIAKKLDRTCDLWIRKVSKFRSKVAIYFEVDLPGARTPVVISKDQSYVISILNIPMKSQPSILTAIEVPDAYYDFDKTVEKPFYNTIFGFNKKQENKLEIFLKEVSTECNTLVQNSPLKRRNQSKNSEIKFI